jgi:cell division septation protein DedD
MCAAMETSPRFPSAHGLLAVLLTLLLAIPWITEPAPAAAAETPPGQTFLDVTPGSTHAHAITEMAGAGITQGCAPRRFCPDQLLTRAQMASLMTRMMDLPPQAVSAFTDVSPAGAHGGNIAALASLGIVQGCGANAFCPARSVTRAQMASVLARAFELTPAGTHPGFSDVAGGVHEPAIRALAEVGITLGCGGGRFCGTQSVTRAQFASLLHRATENAVVAASRPGRGNNGNGNGGNYGNAGGGNGGGNGSSSPTPTPTDPTPTEPTPTDPTPTDPTPTEPPPAEPTPTEPPPAEPTPTEPPPAEPTPTEPIEDEDGEQPAPVGTAFAALLSEDELAVQRHRMTHGPFRTAGDFSANSPGHWNEMAATMNLNFSSARWQGPTGIDSMGRIATGGTNNDPPNNVRQMAHDMMSAAYAAAITNNHTVAAAITKEIEYQATRPNLNYSNRTLWPFNYYNDINPLFMHTVWVKDYVLAYDITKAMGHSSSIVERWFLDLAELNEQIVHENLSRVFPNRKSNSYASRASFVDSTLFGSTRTADGKVVEYPRIMLFYNNRRSNQAGFYGLVGVVLDNTRYKEEFKRYGREWLMFGHRVTSSDGLNGDTNRGNDSFPQLGFSYGLHAMESLIPAMDGLARQGDTSLYEFSSSDGAATPSGGTKHYKTMEGVLDTYIRWIKGSYPAQYTGSGEPPPTSVAGNAFYRIQSRNTGNGREIVNDATLLLPANYYNRTDWHDVIMRQGTPTGFSAVPQNVGSIGGWRSDWRHRFLRSLDTDPYPISR